jgi:hypothetical protein
MTNNLVSHFASAGLDLRLANAPFAGGRNADSIFQLDIRRTRPHDVRSEHFLAWLGSSGNLAAVQGSDPRERQLVLAVRENETEFEEFVPRWIVKAATGEPGSMEWKNSIAGRAGVSAKDVVARSGGASIVRSTRGTTRHMLVGRDERQLFMCELPRPCTSVRQAHDALRTPAARSRSRSALDQPIRQGEWFFVLVPNSEIDELEKAIRKSRVVVRRKASINAFIPRAGKPHVVDEIAVMIQPNSEPRVYARGAVRHADHKTIHISQWRRVLRNLEVDQGRSPFGGTWVD